MSKIAFIFPGQGAQVTGMGMDMVSDGIAVKDSVVGNEIINKANDMLDFDLLDLLSNPEAPINQTAYTQPALLAVSTALLEELKTKTDVVPEFVAGLSLGEYSAHVAAGSMSFADGLKLVRQRGKLMEEAGKETKGAMAAVVKGDKETLEKYCSEETGIVGIANYNSPVQMVISGQEESVASVSKRLTDDGVRVIPLAVSGAFHSPLMEGAARHFKYALDQVELKTMNIPLVTNVTGRVVTEGEDVNELLTKQLKGSVLWQDSVEYMIDQGVDVFVEIGPSKTLSGLIKKINRKVKVLNVNSYETVVSVTEKLNDMLTVDEKSNKPDGDKVVNQTIALDLQFGESI